MPHYQQDESDGWSQADKSHQMQPTGDEQRQEYAETEMEPGWQAARALMQLESETLLALMLRPSFRPVREFDLVPVMPCMHCGDGGMRTAGSVRARRGRELVCACDTCGTILVGEQVWPLEPRH